MRDLHHPELVVDNSGPTVENLATVMVARCAAAADSLLAVAAGLDLSALASLEPRQLEFQRALHFRKLDAARQDLRDRLLELDRLARITASASHLADEDIAAMLDVEAV